LHESDHRVGNSLLGNSSFAREILIIKQVLQSCWTEAAKQLRGLQHPAVDVIQNFFDVIPNSA
jgi:hypothetical protein